MLMTMLHAGAMQGVVTTWRGPQTVTPAGLLQLGVSACLCSRRGGSASLSLLCDSVASSPLELSFRLWLASNLQAWLHVLLQDCGDKGVQLSGGQKQLGNLAAYTPVC